MPYQRPRKLRRKSAAYARNKVRMKCGVVELIPSITYTVMNAMRTISRQP